MQELFPSESVPVRRDEKGERMHQVWRDPHEGASLVDRFPQAPDVAILEVTEASMDDSEGIGRGGVTKILFFDESHMKSAESRVPCGA